MFLYAAVYSSARCALAADTPAHLVDRDLIFTFVSWMAEFQGCGNATTAATDDGNLLRFARIIDHDFMSPILRRSNCVGLAVR